MRCARREGVRAGAGRADQVRGVDDVREAERTEAHAHAIEELAASEEIILDVSRDAATRVMRVMIVKHGEGEISCRSDEAMTTAGRGEFQLN